MSELIAEKEQTDLNEEGGADQYVTFQLKEEVFGFTMASVLEIIRVPVTVGVPLTPSSLLGLANLRGSVLPIVDLRQVLGQSLSAHNDATRVIVADIGRPVGLVVDRVARVMNVDASQIEAASSVQSSIDADLLTGVIKSTDNDGLIQLLNVNQLLVHEFSTILTACGDSGDSLAGGEVSESTEDDEAEDDIDQLVSFLLDTQEYAFNLMDVEEIVRVPETISQIPKANSHVRGLIDLRGRLIPLVSLRRMFVMEDVPEEEHNRILVVTLKSAGQQKHSIGIMVDQVREVLRVEKTLQDDMPALLVQEGDEDIGKVCRLDDGKRLVSVLQIDQLFNHPAMQAAIEAKVTEESELMSQDEQDALDERAQIDDEDENTAQLVVFMLGEQEYGVSIDDVQEITRVPEKMDKVPKTEDFIDGMVNLRGTVLPVLDMRVRFNMQKMNASDRQRILVLSMKGIRTGFIVDSVAEVLRLSQDQIETAPTLSEDQVRMMGRVVNLREQKRMIQVLDAAELLSEKERSELK